MRSLDRVSTAAGVPPKKIRFFCDNCRTEVAREAQECPQCGKSFSSVRCPTCGFSGSLDDFKDCCPACGYSVHSAGDSAQEVMPSPRRVGLSHEHRSESLPLWVYIITGLALIGTLVVLFLTLHGA